MAGLALGVRSALLPEEDRKHGAVGIEVTPDDPVSQGDEPEAQALVAPNDRGVGLVIGEAEYEVTACALPDFGRWQAVVAEETESYAWPADGDYARPFEALLAGIAEVLGRALRGGRL